MLSWYKKIFIYFFAEGVENMFRDAWNPAPDEIKAWAYSN
jgi:hypothetical protein